MKCLHSFAMAIPLAAAMLFAQEPAQSPPGQSQSKTEKANQAQPAQPDPSRTAGQADAGGKAYTGAILDASCTQASALKPGSPVSANEKKDVLKHCQPTTATKSYALLTDDGSFFALDEAGNSQVTAQMAGDKKKSLRVSVTGTVEGNTLKVQSLTKM
jgi:hypothetical protein